MRPLSREGIEKEKYLSVILATKWNLDTRTVI